MSKKTKKKRAKLAQRPEIPSQLLVQQIGHGQHQMLQGDFADAIKTLEPLLSLLPRRSSQRVQVLAMLGLAHGMLQQYQESYALFTEALTIDPTNAELWYNRGLSCRFTTRVGQAVRDFERAVELSINTTGELAQKFRKELKASREQAQEAMQMFDEGITLDQYIQQEECFMRGMSLMRNRTWKEAEQAFRDVIEMGGRLPQYWGNLGVSLIMQSRYDEAETALKKALEIDPEYILARNNLEKLPEVRRVGTVDMEVREPSQEPNIHQSITFYKPGDDSSAIIPHTVIEKTGDRVIGTRTPIGKLEPRYRFFLNPYKAERFTTCPRCGMMSRTRKFTLTVLIEPMYPLLVDKVCRYCYHCDMIILHQDQLEEQLAGHFSTVSPDIIGNDYVVVGTIDPAEWKRRDQDRPSDLQIAEHLHDFKEVLMFERK
ncbi:MAG: tetratricopeptide repeat protein [Ktedonobacteraceae bacterium]